MSDSRVAKNERAAVGERRRPWSRGYDPVVQAVGRVPAKVHTKLLIAFVGTSVLLVAVGLLGLRVLGQSNGRVGSLGSLQERAVGYAKIQQDAKLVRELLAQNANRDYSSVWPGAIPLGSGRKAVPVDQAVADAADRIGPETTVERLGFTPTAADAKTLGLIRLKADNLSMMMQGIIRLDKHDPDGEALKHLRPEAEALARHLYQDAAVLANGITAQIDDLIARNASAYERSRDLFVGVAVGAIVLALVLGFVLSWSVIGPIQNIDPTVAEVYEAGH